MHDPIGSVGRGHTRVHAPGLKVERLKGRASRVLHRRDPRQLNHVREGHRTSTGRFITYVLENGLERRHAQPEAVTLAVFDFGKRAW